MGSTLPFIKNPQLDHLIDVGRSTLNNAKARSAYYQIQRISDTQVVTDPLWQTVGLWAMKSDIHGFHTDSTGLRPVYADLWKGS